MMPRGVPKNGKRAPSRRIPYRASAAYFETKFEFDPLTGCWLWSRSVDPNGYGQHYKDGRVISAHRASWLFYRGPIPEGAQVLHHCDTPPCVNPMHLFLGGHGANMRDRSRKGRHQIAGRPREKITRDQARLIRQSTESTLVLAKRYGIGRPQVRNIQRGRSWKRISDQLFQTGERA